MKNLKSLASLLLFTILMVAVPHYSDAKTKAPPGVEFVPTIITFDVVADVDANQFNQVTPITIQNLICDKLAEVIVISEKIKNVFLETAILDKKTPIFEVLDWPAILKIH